MRKNNKKNALLLASLCLLSLSFSVVSCGGKGESKGQIVGIDSAPAFDVNLKSEEELFTDFNSTHFTAYLTRGEGADKKFATAKGKGVLKSGETVGLYVAGVPEGYEIGVTVTTFDSETGDYLVSKDFSVSTNGKLTAPKVEESKEYRIYVIASEADVEKPTRIRKAIDVTVAPETEIAQDIYADYSGLGTAERTKMAGQLEQYLLNNGLAPITLTNNGGFQLYSERIHSPFLDEGLYVPGYGYGLLTYGTIDAPLSGEQTEKFKMYLHDQVAASDDEGNFNYLDSNSNAVASFYEYISQQWFNQYVNSEKTGTQYEAGLSRKNAPEAINPDENGASDTWKVYLRVGANSDGANGETKGLNYRTASTKFKEFDNRPIQLKDYLTPFKLLATGSVGWFRGSEQAGEATANRQIKGFSEFYSSSVKYTSLPSDKEFQEKVGVKLDSSDNSITITFNGKITPDYAEYQLNGVWTTPICEEFIAKLGGGDVIKGASIYGKNNGTDTPLDTILSVGPYYTSYYETKKTVAYAKNETWPAALLKDSSNRDLYRIQGVHLNLNTKIGTDKNAYIDAFEAGLTDVSNIPASKWDQYATDPRRKKVDGSSVNSFFVNTWDKVFWDENYGDIGTEWDVKPALSNNNFYKALTLAIDREAIADKYHIMPDFTVQEPVNKISPKSTSPYNATQEHKDAVNNAFGGLLGTNQFANWKDNGADYFELALQEELEAGHYTLGTGENPTSIDFTFVSVDGSSLNEQYDIVFNNWKASFEVAVKSHKNEQGVNDWVDDSGRPLIVLNPSYELVSRSSDKQLQEDVIYNGVKVGKYDGQLVFYVSGNGLDVLNNFDKYKSDDSGGFTLNFGLDTSVVSSDVYYNGKYWSYDSLWGAGNIGVLLDEHGKVEQEVVADYNSESTTFGQDPASGDILAKFPFSYNDKYVSNIKVKVDTLKGGTEKYIDAEFEIKDGFMSILFKNSDGAIIPGAALGEMYKDAIYLDFEISYDFTYEGKTFNKSVVGYWLLLVS